MVNAHPGDVSLAVVLHSQVPEDAPPDDQETMTQVVAVSDALRSLGWGVESLPLVLDLQFAADRLRELRPAFVFNLVESIASQGQLIQLAPALMEALEIPYTGSGPTAMLSTTDKLFAKRVMQAAGVPTPAWVDFGAIAAGRTPGKGPCILKSVWEHASIGLEASSVLQEGADLRAGVEERRRRFGGAWFAERYVEGREFNISLLAGGDGPEVLPLAEMEFLGFPAGRPRIVDYSAKWRPGSREYRGTQRTFDLPVTDDSLRADLVDLARECWRLFGLNGYARVDVRVDGEGQPWVLEVNANPSLMPDAGFNAAAGQAGLDFTTVIERIVADCRVNS